MLLDALTTAGLSATSLWAAVPGYAAQVPSPKAALALLDRACAMIGTPPPRDALGTAAAEYDARVAALIAQDEDLMDYVARLETMIDDAELDNGLDVGDTADEPDESEVDPEALVAEVEKYLRDRDS